LHRAPSFAIRSSNNQDRNGKEPFKHAPAQANQTARQAVHQIPARAVTSEEPHPETIATMTVIEGLLESAAGAESLAVLSPFPLVSCLPDGSQ